MKNKCIKCQQIRKASGVSYLKCCKCKQKASDERKKNKKNHFSPSLHVKYGQMEALIIHSSFTIFS